MAGRISFRLAAGIAALFVALLWSPRFACAFGGLGLSNLSGGVRWDAAPRTVGGVERSLDGGLRFSLSGDGSYQTFRDQFHWAGGSPPALDDFRAAVEGAFAAWTVTDPVSGLGTNLAFVYDPSLIATDDRATGAEIDVLAHNFGDSGLRGNFSYARVFGPMTLTSGTTDYFSGIFTGADIRLNSSPTAQFTLASFKILLTHEIGHAIGLDDVDLYSGPFGYFVDDNYDPTNSATALATLTNSFANLIDPHDPSASPLSIYTVANGDPGLDTAGVDILMESAIRTSFFVGAPTALQNDDFAGRQFLYPFVPEPASVSWIILAAMLLPSRRLRSPSFQKDFRRGAMRPQRANLA